MNSSSDSETTREDGGIDNVVALFLPRTRATEPEALIL
jgi:hypothetical protein